MASDLWHGVTATQFLRRLARSKQVDVFYMILTFLLCLVGNKCPKILGILGCAYLRWCISHQELRVSRVLYCEHQISFHLFFLFYFFYMWYNSTIFIFIASLLCLVGDAPQETATPAWLFRARMLAKATILKSWNHERNRERSQRYALRLRPRKFSTIIC